MTISLHRPEPEHDKNGEPLLWREVVQWGEHWEDGEAGKEVDWRVPAPVASPPRGTVLPCVLAGLKQSSCHQLFPLLGPHYLLPCRRGTLRVGYGGPST